MQDQRVEMGELDDRIDAVEGDVEQLGQDVKGNKEAITTVKRDVRQQGERLDELEEVVEETTEKVEELDHKVSTQII